MDQKTNDFLDFDSWLESHVSVKPEYYVVYDENTLAITGIYPKGPAQHKQHKVKVDTILAEEIIKGAISLSRLEIDLEQNELILKTNTVSNLKNNFIKIDSKIEDLVSVSLTIQYNQKENILSFITSENLISIKDKFKDYHKPFLFYITANNDPNILYDTIEIDKEQMFQPEKFSFPLDVENQKFSVYTIKLFKHYYFSIK